MKQQSMKWVAMGVLVLMSLSMAAALCDEEERNQGGRQEQCQPRRLNDCRDFMRGGRGRGQGQGQGQEQPPRRCCEELQRMPQPCRCDAIQQIFEEEAQQYGQDFNQRGQGGRGQGGQQQQRMLERATELPSRCNVQPRRCDIQQRGIFMPGNMW